MLVNSVPFKNTVAPGQFRLPGQHLWVGGPTRWCLVFCSPSGLFHHDQKLTILTRTWYRQDSFIVTQNIASTYRVPIAIGRQKTRHLDTGANSLNRRAVSCQSALNK